jgi:hypothetical protein
MRVQRSVGTWTLDWETSTEMKSSREGRMEKVADGGVQGGDGGRAGDEEAAARGEGEVRVP